MARTLLTGATGTLGTALQPRLRDAGHEVRATSRDPPEGDEIEWVALDLVDGTGIEAAVADVDVVIHAASDAVGDSEAVDVEGTRRLVEAAADAGVANFVYVSIVGIDEIPYSYYEHKLAAERALEDSDVPGTIVRSTQFHEFLDRLLSAITKVPVWPLPTRWQSQPIAVDEVAEYIVEHATPEAAGRVPVVGGPEVLTLGEIASAYREARDVWRPTFRLPVPGAVAGGFRNGEATCPDRAVGTVTWQAFLDTRYGTDESRATTPTSSPS